MNYLAWFVIILAILYLIWKLLLKNNYIIYWFYDPNCPHCSSMKRAWHEFSASTSSEARGIDVTNIHNRGLVQKFRISAVPQIIKCTRSGKIIDIYNGDRSARDILFWADGV